MIFAFLFSRSDAPEGESAPNKRSRPRLVHDSADDREGGAPDLVVAIRNGDVDAFERLYRTHYTSLVYFAIALLRADDAARDVVGDVFLNLWNHRTTWAPSNGVRAYLFGAVRNRANNVIRDRKRELRRDRAAAAEARAGNAPYLSAASMSKEAAGDDDMCDVVWRVVEALPERARLVVQLRWREGLDFGEISAILGISRASAHVLHARAMAALRTCFRDGQQKKS